jgi:hypothetical protein
MKYLTIVIALLLGIAGIALINEVNNAQQAELDYLLEEAYYEGQKDALKGDIRISPRDDTSYVWIKSPWNSGKEPKFKP